MLDGETGALIKMQNVSKFFGDFQALKEIEYQGIVTFESFSSEVVDPVLSNTLAVWRNLWSNSEDLATKALDFIKSNL